MKISSLLKIVLLSTYCLIGTPIIFSLLNEIISSDIIQPKIIINSLIYIIPVLYGVYILFNLIFNHDYKDNYKKTIARFLTGVGVIFVIIAPLIIQMIITNNSLLILLIVPIYGIGGIISFIASILGFIVDRKIVNECI